MLATLRTGTPQVSRSEQLVKHLVVPYKQWFEPPRRGNTQGFLAKIAGYKCTLRGSLFVTLCSECAANEANTANDATHC